MSMTWPSATALRLLITGGDALSHGPAAQLPFEVVNNYGPTECTVVSTWSALKPGAKGAPPIGRTDHRRQCISAATNKVSRF